MSKTTAPAVHRVRKIWDEFALRALPRRDDYAGLSRSWRADLIAGLTVAIVALPLALGFGVTSGVGAAAGLVTAVIAGVVAAVFGGSNLQVSGPTGAMVVILVPIVHQFGPSAVATVAIMAGVIVILGGLLGLGGLVTFIPWPVVEGFTLGIGVTIALQQIPLALNTPAGAGDNAVVIAIRTIPTVNWSAALPAILLALGVIGVMVVLQRVHKGLPASLIAVILATVLAEVLNLDVQRIGALPSSLPAPFLPDFSDPGITALTSAAFAVAALAALESLLAAQVADGMADDIAPGKIPPTRPNRELVGQGLANVASGFFGGMPATGAIARTAVNVRSGARTRMASLIHAFVLAAIVYLAAPLVGTIPLSALGGVLIVTAARMVNLHASGKILRSTRSDALVFSVTAITTIALDLVIAVQIGVAVAAVLTLRHLARSSSITREEIEPDLSHELTTRTLHDQIAVFRIDGSLFFAGSQRFLSEPGQVTDVRVVILRLSNIQVLDASGANALGELVKELRRRDIAVLITGLRPEHRQVMASVGELAKLERRKHVFTKLAPAIEHARKHVRRELEAAIAAEEIEPDLEVTEVVQAEVIESSIEAEKG